MYRIVASDLDGTLLNHEHVVAPFSREVLQRLHNKGEHFVFATGRHHVDVSYIRKTVGIPAFMITSNGARVHDENDNLIFSHNVDAALIQPLLNLAKDDERISIHLYRDNDWLVSRAEKDLEQYHKDSGFHFSLFDKASPPVENIAKLFYICQDHELLLTLENQILAKFGQSISIAFSTPFCLEIMGQGVSKGAALSEVAKLKGISLNECIAFGDGMNDVEMLLAVKKGLVMGDAPLRVKQRLSHLEVIGSNKDESVAKYLAKHLLKI